jgi:hypothetical protein
MSDLLSNEGALVLGTYSEETIWKHFKKFGILERIQNEGYKELIIKTDASDPFVHRITLTDKSLLKEAPGKDFLIDIFLRRRTFHGEEFKAFQYPDQDDEARAFMKQNLNWEMHLSIVEWLAMQNPRKEFTPRRPQLPGQRFPGLGVGREFAQMLRYLSVEQRNGGPKLICSSFFFFLFLILMCVADRDGLMEVPEHFHNAVIYSIGQSYYFVNPSFQGYFVNLICKCNSLCEGEMEFFFLLIDVFHSGLGRCYCEQRTCSSQLGHRNALCCR